jgi:hypothetical protein
MSGPILRHSYANREECLAAACAWLSQLGVKIAGTRVSRYARDLRRVREFHEAGKIEMLLEQHGRATLLNSLIEADELIDVYEGLGAFRGAELVARLEKFVSGCTMTSDEESPTNIARNTGFELLTAAALQRVGVPVEFRAPMDVWVPLEPHPIAIECKRPLSASKIVRRIKQGLDQLKDHYAQSMRPEAVRGILALNISKVVNDGSRALDVANAEEIDRHTGNICDSFIAQHDRYWRGLDDSRTLSILIYLRVPCFVKTPRLLTIALQTAFVSLHAEGSANRQILETVHGPFKAFAQRMQSGG